MTTNVIEVTGLVKTYKKTNALDHVTLNVRKGAIFGLIGPNGAGKSTFMKMLCGIIHESEGSLKLFGKEPESDPYVYRRIGALIENAGLYPGLNAFDNLKLKSLSMGCTDDKRIYELLDICELQDTKKKKVKNFSLGMKQRLGIAMALLGEPELLILDEPTNGLDPQGINDMRNILFKLNIEKQMTILISSHILEELSKIATDYAILKKGKLVECISKEELQERCKECFKLVVNNARAAIVCLEETLGIQEYEILPDQVICLYDHYENPSHIARLLLDHSIEVYEMSAHKQDLETYFLKKSGDENDQ